ncbi:galectin-4-like [Toxorhynchites rutilus septentrionalis]|uniref:galectin-4-like n=1 Tax=Toxorhynchites rutilus septentrionalis TaxID=329112 RepID=UPI002479D444|nr:galectin-4-like [Toxorhynchites rutilus septentrionalis]
MATIPVENTSIPFLGEIPGGLFAGKSLHIRGQVTGNDFFNINLQTGAAVDPRDDAPLHISIRPGDRRIIRTSYEGGAWQNEERDGRCPISIGTPFDMEIKVKDSYYSIIINGNKFCKFNHRLPVESVRFIHIGLGGVIESISEYVA